LRYLYVSLLHITLIIEFDFWGILYQYVLIIILLVLNDLSTIVCQGTVITFIRDDMSGSNSIKIWVMSLLDDP